MQNVNYLLFLFGLLLLGSNCSKEVPLMTLEYAETKCSDPWGTNEGNSKEEVESALMAFLENELNISNATIKISFEEKAEACEACSCKTGRKITVTVEEGFVPILEDNGFFLKG